jgi:hypothetical protein
VDRLDNEDIGLIWGRHYPKRTESQSSKSLCITLAMIIKQRAASNASGDWAYKLERALAAAGVPRDQFDSVEAETKFDK